MATKINESVKETIQAMYVAKAKIAEIVDATGVSKRTVIRYTQELRGVRNNDTNELEQQNIGTKEAKGVNDGAICAEKATGTDENRCGVNDSSGDSELQRLRSELAKEKQRLTDWSVSLTEREAKIAEEEEKLASRIAGHNTYMSWQMAKFQMGKDYRDAILISDCARSWGITKMKSVKRQFDGVEDFYKDGAIVYENNMGRVFGFVTSKDRQQVEDWVQMINDNFVTISPDDDIEGMFEEDDLEAFV